MSEHAFDLECESSGLLRVAYLVADLRLSLTARKFAGHLRRIAKFNPYHDELGRFTTADGDAGAASDSAEGNVRVAQAESGNKYSVDLAAQDDALGGHTIRDHVDKSDEELLDVVRRDRYDGLTITVARIAEGTFLSKESANDLVNRTLESYQDRVDAVASGVDDEAVLNKRFGYVTGKEAYRPDPEAEPYIRSTYSVRVVIQPDKRSDKGYRILTAFPTNEKPSDD